MKNSIVKQSKVYLYEFLTLLKENSTKYYIRANHFLTDAFDSLAGLSDRFNTSHHFLDLGIETFLCFFFELFNLCFKVLLFPFFALFWLPLCTK